MSSAQALLSAHLGALMTASGFFKVMGCVATLLTFNAESAMANSLLLLSPAQLAGGWTFYSQDNPAQTCTVQLLAENKSFGPEVKCLASWLGQVPVSWTPTPDGVFFIDKKGTDIVHMNRAEADTYEARLTSGKVLRMKRKRKP